MLHNENIDELFCFAVNGMMVEKIICHTYQSHIIYSLHEKESKEELAQDVEQVVEEKEIPPTLVDKSRHSRVTGFSSCHIDPRSREISGRLVYNSHNDSIRRRQAETQAQ